MKPIFAHTAEERRELLLRRRGEFVELIVDRTRGGARESYFGEILTVAIAVTGGSSDVVVLRRSNRYRFPDVSISTATIREIRSWSAYPEEVPA